MSILLPRTPWVRQAQFSSGLVVAFDGALVSPGASPIIQTTPVQRWSGTRGVLASAVSSGAQLTASRSISGDRTVLLFARVVNSGSTAVWFTSSSGSGVSYWLGTSGGTWTVGGDLNAPAGGAPNGSDQVVVFRRIGTTDSIWINGAQVASGNSGTSDGTGLNFLSFGVSGFEIFTSTGGLYQGAVWSRALSDQAIADLSRQLLWRRAVPLSATRRRGIAGASGGGITATATLTDAADALSAEGALSIAAQLSVTDAGDSISSAAALTVSAGATLTDAADSLSAEASTGGLLVTFSQTDEADSLSAVGTLALSAAAGVTDSTDALSASAGILIVAQMGVTDAVDALAAEATVGGIVLAADIVDAGDSLLAEAELGSIVVPETPVTLGWRHRRIDDIPSDPVVVSARLVDSDDIIVAGVAIGYPVRRAAADLRDDDDMMSGAGMLLPMYYRSADGLLRPMASAKTAFYCICDQCGGFKPVGNLAS